jgi:orotate phosphoribosyltransferase
MHAIPIDAIACTDGTEIIGGFLADALSGSGVRSINYGNKIAVLTPEINTGGQMIFRDNIQGMIWNKNVLILVASATTGISVKRLAECITYYGGKPAGVCAIFSAISETDGLKINRLFTTNELPRYRTFHAQDCPLCQNGTKLDAIVNSYGYSKI